MSHFVAKPVLSEYKTIGDQLRLARLEKGLEMGAVAKELRVPLNHLRAIEEEDYQELPAGLYGKIFLKRYASYLGLDQKALLKTFAKERSLAGVEEEDVFSKKVVKRSRLIIFPKLFRNLLLILIILICFLYLSFYLKKITTPPFLEIIEPQEKQVQSEFSANISGKTEPESEVFINGEMIPLNKEGYFSTAIHLSRGVNIIVVKAKKKYSREKVLTRQILVE